MGLSIFGLVLFALTLQIFGTAILGLFSFYGIQIDKSKNSFANGKPVTHVTINKAWLNLARAGLILLLVGIGMGGWATIATLPAS